MNDLEWLDSKCIGTSLHRYEIWKVAPTCVVEVCAICKNEIYFNLIDGKVDNLDYLNYHLRQALPKWHPYYEAEYGKKVSMEQFKKKSA